MGQLYDPSCKVWLQWNTKQYCDTKGGFKNMLRETQRFPNERRALPFDRVLGDGDEKPAAILYGDIAAVQATEFREFHTILKDYAMQGLLSYRVRYRSPLESQERPLVLSGYGVELALKKTDYMVMDDRGVEGEEAKEEDGTVKQSRDKDQVLLGELSDEEAQDIKPLHEKDIASLGFKAASFVMKSEDPFNTLQRLSQDFPKHSAAIAAGEIDPSVQEELGDNWDMFIGNGKNALFINGLQLDTSQINTFALIEHLRRERGYVNKLRALGLNSSEAIQLLSHKILAEAKENEQIQRYDYRDDTEGGEVIAWLNDLEKDKRYKEWSPAVNTVSF
jgi:UDP-glucose:glycoprotein glucosyltransferase